MFAQDDGAFNGANFKLRTLAAGVLKGKGGNALCDARNCVDRTRRGDRAEREPSVLHLDEFDVIAGLQSKLFTNTHGQGNAAVEGDHCRMHVLPL